VSRVDYKMLEILVLTSYNQQRFRSMVQGQLNESCLAASVNGTCAMGNAILVGETHTHSQCAMCNFLGCHYSCLSSTVSYDVL
jgi:hypothetical protein